MSTDPKITDTLMYGDDLCQWQRIATAFVWDDDWLVFGDENSRFGMSSVRHLAVQFRRRPTRERYVDVPPSSIPVGRQSRVLEDA
jgi:hypothetical protein